MGVAGEGLEKFVDSRVLLNEPCIPKRTGAAPLLIGWSEISVESKIPAFGGLGAGAGGRPRAPRITALERNVSPRPQKALHGFFSIRRAPGRILGTSPAWIWHEAHV